MLRKLFGMKDKILKEVYEKLDTKEVVKDTYKITQIIERKSRDFYTIKYVEDEDQKVLSKEEEIKKK